MSRHPKVRTRRVVCPECGSSLTVHLPPLFYERLHNADAPEWVAIWGMGCPAADCDGLLTVTLGDARRAQAA